MASKKNKAGGLSVLAVIIFLTLLGTVAIGVTYLAVFMGNKSDAAVKVRGSGNECRMAHGRSP